MMKLTGKNVVITGASSGIGRSLALQLAKEGCSLALLARRVEELETVARQASQYNVTRVFTSYHLIKNAWS